MPIVALGCVTSPARVRFRLSAVGGDLASKGLMRPPARWIVPCSRPKKTSCTLWPLLLIGVEYIGQGCRSGPLSDRYLISTSSGLGPGNVVAAISPDNAEVNHC